MVPNLFRGGALGYYRTSQRGKGRHMASVRHRMKRYLKSRLDYAILGIIYLVISATCLAILYFLITDGISGREDYQTITPFYYGAGLALILGFWPPAIVFKGNRKHLARAILITLCIAPLPFGGEGTLVPTGIGLLYPPILIVFPSPLFSLIALFCMSAAADSMWTAITGKGLIAEQWRSG